MEDALRARVVGQGQVRVVGVSVMLRADRELRCRRPCDPRTVFISDWQVLH
jgi:hypothetical protein